LTTDLYEAVQLAADWLDRENGTTGAEKTMRLFKLAEEAGEVAKAWIGYTGQNPRKGHTHTLDDVVGELADVVMTALVAMRSLGADPQQVMGECVAKVVARSVVQHGRI
jgi:NTP pyrophosphatase (non-canonical NTP hydrolase)